MLHNRFSRSGVIVTRSTAPYPLNGVRALEYAPIPEIDIILPYRG